MQTSSGLPECLTALQCQRIQRVHQQLRIEMVSARWWRVREGWRMRPRRVADDFLFVPLTRRLRVRLESREATLMPGQALLAPAKQLHSAELVPPCPELQVVAIHANLLPTWGGSLKSLLSEPFPTLPDLAATEARLARLVHLMNTLPDLGREMGVALLRDWLTFWTLADPASSATEPVRADARVIQAMEIIHEQFHRPWTVGKLAEEVRLRPVQFRKLFKRACSVGPRAYLAQHRLKQAASQLRNTGQSVKEIAFATGFTDPHYFHLAFRRQFGVTPLTYRSRARRGV